MHRVSGPLPARLRKLLNPRALHKPGLPLIQAKPWRCGVPPTPATSRCT